MLFDYNDCFNYMFSRAQQHVLQVFREELSILDITPVQYGILMYLLQYKDTTPAKLVYHFKLEPPTITGIIERLEKKGMVTRETCEDDRRTYNIRTTNKAEEIKEDLLKASKRANGIIVDMIGKENVPFLKDILHNLYNSEIQSINN